MPKLPDIAKQHHARPHHRGWARSQRTARITTQRLKFPAMMQDVAHPFGSGCRKHWRFLLFELDTWRKSKVSSNGYPCRNPGGIL